MAARRGEGAKRRAAAPRRRQAKTAPAAGREELDLGYAEYRLTEQQVEEALRTGEKAGLLEDYFGADAYAELVRLARQVPGERLRGGQKVWILPGIMGSTLSKGSDLYWFDPLEIWRGGLEELALVPGAPAFRASGVILMTYLKLKLSLQLAGLDASFRPFDWRRSIDDLGKQLAAELSAEGSGKVNLVAHSMGGLVARSALGHGGSFRRLVQLGTPNFGSFAPVLALRGVSSVVQTLGRLDRKHDVDWLVRNVLTTLPGLVQLMPTPEKYAAIDLYDIDEWPMDGLSPQPELLPKARAVQAGLPHGHQLANCFLIAGVNQPTVTDLSREGGTWKFERTTTGDGTVPLDMCLLPELEERTYFVEEEHGALPNNSTVVAALCDLVDQGRTDRLPTDPPRARSPRRELLSEDRLREAPLMRSTAAEMSRREVREALSEFVAPGGAPATTSLALPGHRAAPAEAEAGLRHQLHQVVVGRRHQHRLDLRVALGSITEAPTRALALGIFKDVAPSGAALALDARMRGAITEITQRRMFSGNLGEVFVLPTGRHALAADLVAFVGLGSFDRFSPEALQIAAENILRTFITTAVEEFSTVVIGGGSGESPDSALRNLLGGFVRALLDADRDHHFRRVVICERDPERFVAIKEELYRLASTDLCEDLELTFDETELLPPPEAPRGPGAGRRGEDPVYLLVRQEGDPERDPAVTLQSSVLTAEGKAALLTRRQKVPAKELEALLRRLTSKKPSFEKDGPALGRLVLEPAVRTVLATQRSRHLVVVHDALTSRIPWETLALTEGDGPWFPAAERGLTRRYEAENLVVAKWLKERVTKETLEVLLVVNPTGDLGGAEDEGERVRELFAGKGGVRLTVLHREEATRKALLEAFGSGRFDVIHYAGHAYFDPRNPESSGLLAAGEEVVSGADLSGVANLPSLVFFNACESGRVRGKPRERGPLEPPLRKLSRSEHQVEAVGLAEALMRGGVANLVGTYWPVGDAGAVAFAQAFYSTVLDGQALREAVQAGRLSLRQRQPPLADWANYLFYGNPDFVLKLK